jgi:hypothetical protein
VVSGSEPDLLTPLVLARAGRPCLFPGGISSSSLLRGHWVGGAGCKGLGVGHSGLSQAGQARSHGSYFSVA